ncbi:MAG: hypothetical protein ACQERO_12750 [Bacteroidota bacterium]
MKINLSRTFWVLLLPVMILWVGCSGREGEQETETPAGEIAEFPRLMIQPGDTLFFRPIGHITDGYQTPRHLEKEAVHSFIFVEPADSISNIRNYESGKTLNFSLGEDLMISAKINRNQAIGERIRNLTATVKEPYEGVVTLSVNDTTITGNIDLVSQNRLFHIRYDSISGLHYVADIDRSKLDVMQGSDPLELN